MGRDLEPFEIFAAKLPAKAGHLAPQEYSPLVLAYVGDAVLELYVRTRLLASGNMPVHKLHVRASHIVSAKAQSAMVDKVQTLFTEEEERIFKRGRNAKSYSSPKNTELSDYKRSTGFEALVGYLYLKQDLQRLRFLLDTCLDE